VRSVGKNQLQSITTKTKNPIIEEAVKAVLAVEQLLDCPGGSELVIQKEISVKNADLKANILSSLMCITSTVT
jgi:hypothetical protein